MYSLKIKTRWMFKLYVNRHVHLCRINTIILLAFASRLVVSSGFFLSYFLNIYAFGLWPVIMRSPDCSVTGGVKLAEGITELSDALQKPSLKHVWCTTLWQNSAITYGRSKNRICIFST